MNNSNTVWYSHRGHNRSSGGSCSWHITLFHFGFRWTTKTHCFMFQRHHLILNSNNNISSDQSTSAHGYIRLARYYWTYSSIGPGSCRMDVFGGTVSACCSSTRHCFVWLFQQAWSGYCVLCYNWKRWSLSVCALYSFSCTISQQHFHCFAFARNSWI